MVVVQTTPQPAFSEPRYHPAAADICDRGLKDNYKDNNRDNYKDRPGVKESAIPQAHNKQNKLRQSHSLGIARSLAAE